MQRLDTQAGLRMKQIGADGSWSKLNPPQFLSRHFLLWGVHLPTYDYSSGTFHSTSQTLLYHYVLSCGPKVTYILKISPAQKIKSPLGNTSLIVSIKNNTKVGTALF